MVLIVLKFCQNSAKIVLKQTNREMQITTYDNEEACTINRPRDM